MCNCQFGLFLLVCYSCFFFVCASVLSYSRISCLRSKHTKSAVTREKKHNGSDFLCFNNLIYPKCDWKHCKPLSWQTALCRHFATIDSPPAKWKSVCSKDKEKKTNYAQHSTTSGKNVRVLPYLVINFNSWQLTKSNKMGRRKASRLIYDSKQDYRKDWCGKEKKNYKFIQRTETVPLDLMQKYILNAYVFICFWMFW